MKVLLDFLPIIILAICVIVYIYVTQDLRKEVKILKEIKNRINTQIEEEKNELENLNHLELKTREDIVKLLDDQKAALKDKEVAIQRAAEAQEATNRLLVSEQERLAAQIRTEEQLERERMQQRLKTKDEELALLYEKKLNELSSFYNKQSEELENSYRERKEAIDDELITKQLELDEFRKIRESVNQAILRNKELKEKSDFYSLQISQSDREDISILQSMDLRLHHRDVIPKIIWELFIRRPLQEMEKRVIGATKRSGIYKITNKETGEAYIGKTSDFATRWQNHCKTAVGLDGAAHATLHTRLAQDGIWNYTFEILEDVDKDHLSEREAYYIDLYGTKSQLNMKEGSSK